MRMKLDHYYYKLALINKDDSVYSVPRYLFTLDQKPPSHKNLEEKIDSLGVVTLKWSSPEENDIKGYRVFRANQKREEFIEITSQFIENLSYRHPFVGQSQLGSVLLHACHRLKLQSIQNVGYHFNFKT